MQRSFRASLATIIGLGIVVCLIVAALTHGDPFDMESFRLVRAALDHGPLNIYRTFADAPRWPYPPGYFPVVWLAGRVATLGVSFAFVLRIPVILADGCIAWLVQDYLGRCGASSRRRLLAAGLVSLGPSFILIAGFHGQFDAVAILPDVLALSLWTRGDIARRAIYAGLLIGIGGALKTVPLLLVLALLPSARSRREAVVLVVAAAVPLAVAFLPFALAGTLPSAHLLTYRGLPGAGDLSLAAQPNLAEYALGISVPSTSSLTKLLIAHGTIVTAAAMLAVLGVGIISRASAPKIAVLLWLAVYAFGVNFFFQYVVWGLPFFLMAGYAGEVVGAQVLLIVPAWLFYLRPWHHVILAGVYATMMIGMWVAVVLAFAVFARHLVGHRERVAASAT